MFTVNSIENKAENRISFGNQTALALLVAIKNSRDPNEIAFGCYHRMMACSARSNHWTGDNLRNKETGKSFRGTGNLWSCGSKLCSSCSARIARRSRRKLKLALEHQRLQYGESYQFITLTMPNPNLPLSKTRLLINKAWQLFRKRKCFVENIRGAAKNEEFTRTKNGYHYHIHLLCISKFLDFQEFRSNWTDCVETAFSKLNLEFKVNNRDGLLNVVIEQVKASEDSLKTAIQKVCNYVTKSDNWAKIPADDLMEIATLKRFPRRFELLGSFSKQTDSNKVNRSQNPDKITETRKNVTTDSILDNKYLSDGSEYDSAEPVARYKLKKRQRRLPWRQHIEKFGLDSYLKRLKGDVMSGRGYMMDVLSYRHVQATFKTLDGEDFYSL